MKRRSFVAAAGASLAAPLVASAQTAPGTATPASEGDDMATPASPAPQTGYAPVNGLEMYYEIHGAGQPLLLLHGAYNSIDFTFGAVLPTLARSRRVIAVETQGHGRTADIDRPLTYEQMADDAAALLQHLGIARADVFGYSMGAGTALQLAIRHPDLVRKLVLVSVTFNSGGLHPEVLAGISAITPEAFAGTPFEEEYFRLAPNPDDWPVLVDKLKQLDLTVQAWLPADIQGIAAPTLAIIGDSDIVRPEHAVELFRLLGGGVPGDLAGLPNSQLAILPGATHISVILQTDLLLAIISQFLDAPMPETA